MATKRTYRASPKSFMVRKYTASARECPPRMVGSTPSAKSPPALSRGSRFRTVLLIDKWEQIVNIASEGWMMNNLPPLISIYW